MKFKYKLDNIVSMWLPEMWGPGEKDPVST